MSVFGWIRYNKKEEQVLVLTKKSETRFSIRLYGVKPEGKEVHLGDHAIRDCVRLLTGKSWDEFQCDYDYVGTTRTFTKKHLKLVIELE